MRPLFAYAVIGFVCSIIANAPALLQARPSRANVFSNRRLIGLLLLQIILFGAFSALLGYLQRERRIASLTQAVLFGGLLGLISILIAPRGSRGDLRRSVLLGSVIVVCSAAAFLLAPKIWAW